MPETRLQLPELGLSDEQSFTDQPPLTTRDAQNVRFRDPVTNRKRFSQRSGLGKYVSSALPGKVHHLATAVDSGSTASYGSAEESSDLVELWREETPGNSFCRCVHYDPVLDLVYALDGETTIRTYNTEGVLLGSIPVGLTAAPDDILQSELFKVRTDSIGRLYVVDGAKVTYNVAEGTPSSDWVDSVAGFASTRTRVRMFVNTGVAAGQGYTEVWSDGIETQSITDMAIVGDALYTVVVDGLVTDPGLRVNKYSLGGAFPELIATGLVIPFADIPGSGTPGDGYDSTPFAKVAADESGNVYVALYMTGEQLAANDAGGGEWLSNTTSTTADPTGLTHLYKFEPDLDDTPVWTVAGGDITLAGHRVMHGIALEYSTETDLLYTVGAEWIDDGGGTPLRGKRTVTALDVGDDLAGPVAKWINPLEPDTDPGGTGDAAYVDPFLSIAVDQLGNVYVPCGLYPFKEPGAAVALIPPDGFGPTPVTLYYVQSEFPGAFQSYFSVSVGPRIGSGLPNLINWELVNSFDGWTQRGGAITVTEDSFGGPFTGSNGDTLESSDATFLLEVPFALGGLDDDISSPVFSVEIKEPSSGAATASRLEINEGTYGTPAEGWRCDIDWTTSPPTATYAEVNHTGSTPAGTVGVTGPVNGYYRFWVHVEGEVAAPKVWLYPNTGAGTASIIAALPKFESSTSGKPTPVPNRWGSDRIFAGALGEPIFDDDQVGLEGETFSPLRALRLLTPGSTSDFSRRRSVIGVSEGDLYLLDADADETLPIAGAQRSLSSEEGLDSSPYFIDSTFAYGKLIFVDGVSTLIYDIRDGSISTLKSSSAGQAPRFARLCTAWQGRLFLAGFADQPDDWIASRQGDITNFDTSPVVQSVLGAVNATTAEYASGVTDVITALAPQNDDRLLIGCDHSLFEFLGNPGDRGQIDQISTKVGMAFGRAWAQDPQGNTFFLSNEGRMYVRGAGGGPPQPVTTYTIDKRLEDIDLTTYRVELAWNNADHGLHVFQVFPGGAAPAVVNHWFFEMKHNGIWEDRINSTDKLPGSVLVLDGDSAGDRQLLLGCEDGFVRTWDASANDDDGTAILAYALMGPYQLGEDREVRMSHLRTKLDPAYSGLRAEIYAEDEPQVLGSPVAVRDVPPGSSQNLRFRARSSYAYLRFSNGSAAQRFSVESAYLGLYLSGGRRRVNS